MRSFTSIPFVLLLPFLLAPGIQARSASPDVDARQFVQELQARYQAQDLDGFLALCHPALESPSREILKQILEHFFAQPHPPRIVWEVQEVESQAESLTVHIASQEWHDPNQEEPIKKKELFILKQHEDQWRLAGLYERTPAKRLNKETGRYTSKKGKFSLKIPTGWMPLQGPLEIRGITIDSVTLMAQRDKAQLTLGVLQLPLQLSKDASEAARTAIHADCAMVKRMSASHQILSEGPTEVAGRKGYQLMARLEPKAKDGGSSATRQRLRLYFLDESILYFIVCDTLNPESFESLEPQFRGIINSFQVEKGDDGLSLQEALAAQGGEGAVTDRVYTSEKFNCFIAAPDGWEIRTNPDPITLVEMRYTPGHSIARIIAAKGVGHVTDPMEAMEKRLQDVRKIVKDFMETGRREVTVQETPAVESTQTFTVDGLGEFNVKEITVIRDGTYYLILCQCIEPDKYTDLESDFDKIIDSFGFIQ